MPGLEFDASSVEYAGKVQLKKFGQFLQKQSDDFGSLESGWPMLEVDWAPSIRLDYCPTEEGGLFKLVNTENVMFNKAVIVLASLSAESERLESEARTKFYPALLMYGEGGASEEGKKTGVPQVMIAHFLPLLQELSCFVDRCYGWVRNVILQMAAIDDPRSRSMINFENVHFETIFENLCEILKILLCLDEIITRHCCLADHWNTYIKTIKLVHHNPEKFKTTRVKLKPLETVLQKMNSQLMSGLILQNCAEQPLSLGDVAINRSQRLSTEFVRAAKTMYSKIEKMLGEPGETGERSMLVGICALTVFSILVFRSVDKKSFKQVFDSYKKVPLLHLVGDIFWSPTEFLLKKFPNLDKAVDRKAIQSFRASKLNYLNARKQCFATDCSACVVQLSDWLLQLSSMPEWSSHISRDLDARAKIMLQGIRFAYSICHLVRTVIGLHIEQKCAMDRDCVVLVLRMIQLTKAIEGAFDSHWLEIMQCMPHIVQSYQSAMLKILESTKQRLQSDSGKLMKERYLDILSALVLAQNALTGPASKQRLVVLSIAIDVAAQSGTFYPDDLNSILVLKRKLRNVVNLRNRLSEACDCSFIYWQRSLLAAHFKRMLQHPMNANELQHIFRAVTDCFPLLSRVRHLAFPDHLGRKFEEEVTEVFKENLLDKLCVAVETDLRLSIHTHLQLETRNPFKPPFQPVLNNLLALPPLRLNESVISVKAHVEKYLEATFYNLTTVALHDWRTYAEMRQLALQKYGLILVDANLPCHQLDQGLDVLEIMRNIQQFVVKYNYNLNNQIFVERTSNNKHLNTISIRHVANSIRTHGAGIKNTTVNFTYQFLRKKFYTFSQFLFDEQIKSRLVKDIRYFKENKDQLNKRYPFGKAEKFNRGIRKLGLNPEGLSYLDQFRILVSQIGNAMGYVRLIRSGALECCAQAVQFIPDLDDILSFADMASVSTSDPSGGEASEARSFSKFSDQTLSSAGRLDAVIENLTKSFDGGASYFRILVDVFANEFRSAKNMHLRNFFIIIPSLTVNHVDYLMTSKDRIFKKGTTGATFTDDGFAMGIAYILELLDQHLKFDSLHWFESVRSRFQKQKTEMVQQSRAAATSKDEKLLQTLALSLKRLEQHEKEFDLLNYSLSSARIFFRSDAADEKDELSSAGDGRIGKPGGGGSDAASDVTSVVGASSVASTIG